MLEPARIPLSVKVAYTLWMAIWVPVYWRANGPSNFLWLCDFANFGVLAALWLESGLLASAQLAGVLVIQLLWAVDFLSALVTGAHPIGGTEYMLDSARPLWLRGLSLFHLWTAPLLVWMVRRLGYDARGWKLQSSLALVLLPLGQQIGTREQNLNWMWAPFGMEQRLLPPLFFAVVAVPIVAAVLFWPGHWIARRWLARRIPDIAQS
jgi:hypothetical protein